MRSKTSFFNAAVLRQTAFRRYWPVWVIYAIMLTWGMAVAVLDGNAVGDFALEIAPMLGIFSGLVVALCCFGYLHNAKSAHFYHALPVGRVGLFVSQCLSGIVMLFLPILICWLVMWAVTPPVLWVEVFYEMLTWLIVMLLSHFFFFAFGVLIAMLTGHIVAHIIYYGVFSFLAIFIRTISSALMSLYLYGFSDDLSDNSITIALTPVVQMMMSREIYVYLIYAAVAVVLLLAALLLYRKRRIEVAGDVIAVSPIRPVVIYGFAVCFSFLITMFFGLTFDIFQTFTETAMTIGLVVFSVIGYFIARMLAYKTFRVFKKGWIGALSIFAAMLALTLCLQLDITGYEKRAPEMEDVEFVIASVNYNDRFYAEGIAAGEMTYWMNQNEYDLSRIDPLTGDIAIAAREYAPGLFAQQENIALATQLHQAVVQTYKDTHNMMSSAYSDNWSWYSLNVLYQYKDGRQLERRYYYYLGEQHETVASAMNALYNTQEYRMKAYAPPALSARNVKSAVLFDRQAQDYPVHRYEQTEEGASSVIIENQQDGQALLGAVLEDIRQGNIGRFYPVLNDDFQRDITGYALSISYDPVMDDYLSYIQYGGRYYSDQPGLTVSLSRGAVHTLNCLRALGVDTEPLLAPVPDDEVQLFRWYNTHTQLDMRTGYYESSYIY